MGNIRVFNKTISYQVEGSLKTKIYCFKSQWRNLNLLLKMERSRQFAWVNMVEERGRRQF